MNIFYWSMGFLKANSGTLFYLVQFLFAQGPSKRINKYVFLRQY